MSQPTLSPLVRWSSLAAFFGAVTVLMTWPLARDPFHVALGPPSDNLYFVWLIEWYRRAIVELHRFTIDVPFLNAPEGWNLAYNEMTPVMALLGLPVAFMGPAAAYNASVFASFVLSGIFTFQWVRQLGGNTVGGLLAGVCFAFAPYRLMHALSHLNLLGTQWLPLFFSGLTSLVGSPGRSLRPAVVTAGALLLIAGTSQYYLYMTLVAAVPVALVLLRSRREWYRDHALLKRALLTAVLAAPVAFVLWPYFALARQGLLPARPLSAAQIWAANPTDYFVPSPLHAYLGGWLEQHLRRGPSVESTLHVSMISAGLAFLVLRRARRDPMVAALGVAMVVTFVLSLGTELHVRGQIVQVPIPGFLHPWVRASSSAIVLPGRLLFAYLPYYANMRVWSRWGIFVSLFVSVLAGMGLAQVTRRWSRRGSAILVAVLIIIVIVEFRQRPYPTSPIAPRPVDAWLAAQVGGGAVAVMPVGELTTPQGTFFTMFHRKPFIGAFFSAFESPQFRRIEPTLRSFPDAASIAVLRTLGVRWVVLTLDMYGDPTAVRVTCAGLGLHEVFESKAHIVFDLEGRAAASRSEPDATP